MWCVQILQIWLPWQHEVQILSIASALHLMRRKPPYVAINLLNKVTRMNKEGKKDTDSKRQQLLKMRFVFVFPISRSRKVLWTAAALHFYAYGMLNSLEMNYDLLFEFRLYVSSMKHDAICWTRIFAMYTCVLICIRNLFLYVLLCLITCMLVQVCHLIHVWLFWVCHEQWFSGEALMRKRKALKDLSNFVCYTCLHHFLPNSYFHCKISSASCTKRILCRICIYCELPKALETRSFH